MGQIELDTPVQYVKGVGPTRADQLAQLGIDTVEDLLLYFPRRFDLRRQTQPIASLRGDEVGATVAGEVVEVDERRFGRRPFFQCLISDADGSVAIKWFNGGYLRDRIRPGIYIAISGKASIYKEQIQFINPRFQIIWSPSETRLDQDELLPVYPAGAGLTSPMIGKVASNVLPLAEELIPEWFDRDYLRQRAMMARPAAVAAMHHPEDKDHWSEARRRMAYDECILMQLAIAMLRAREAVRPAYPLPNSEKIDQHIRARFGFKLTDAQDRCIEEIAADLSRDRPMNRLLQGDVGCGKTVVALYAALLAVANGKQAAIMAPTEILASQHYRKIESYLAGSRVRLAMLVGAMPAKKRRRIIDDLAAGKVDMVIGTHALISKGVKFAKLGLVVVDEQHKFGVRQRSTFRGKGYAPHYLVMTATPIPRTLALTVFGDLDVSTVDALPPGRGKTTTVCIGEDELPSAMELVRSKLAEGQQAYFIYPLVNPSPDLELTAAEDAYRDLADGELRDFNVGLIHGQLPQAEKDRVMAEFRAGNIQVLVASVVVEVGVDVAAANVMVIVHAERFGLAQLHQLRGRIGRSSQDANCILVASPANPIARRRLDVLVETSDGFKVAEEDLRIRGPGEFFGTRQHGLPELKVADLIEDFELMRMARRDAMAIIEQDSSLSLPHNQQLRRELLRAYAGRFDLLSGA